MCESGAASMDGIHLVSLLFPLQTGSRQQDVEGGYSDTNHNVMSHLLSPRPTEKPRLSQHTHTRGHTHTHTWTHTHTQSHTIPTHTHNESRQ